MRTLSDPKALDSRFSGIQRPSGALARVYPKLTVDTLFHVDREEQRTGVLIACSTTGRGEELPVITLIAASPPFPAQQSTLALVLPIQIFNLNQADE